jgi:hypothetical protein
MRLFQRKVLLAGLLGLLVIALAIVALASGSLNAFAKSANSQTTGPAHSQEVVDRYLGILNDGMANPTCDFSQLSTIYASNATVTLTGGPFAPGGPFGPGNAFGAQQYHGIQAITGAFTKLCHILYSKNAGAPSWTQDQGYLLSPNVLNSYEHVSLGGHMVGRCMHVFTVNGDHIQSLDWSVYA